MLDQAALRHLYDRWRDELKGQSLGFDPARYSPPLLINMPHPYMVSERRILFCGQETLGWEWESRDYPGGTTFADFLNSERAVEGLLDEYEAFAFARNYSKRGSPFWSAFREIMNWNLGEMLWANLSRMDFRSDGLTQRSILLSPDRDAVIDTLGDLFCREIEITRPDAIVFVTGPDYDWIIERFFPGVDTQPLDQARSVLRLSHPHLPPNAFRTYHPNALRFQKRWGDLEVVRAAMATDFGHSRSG